MKLHSYSRKKDTIALKTDRGGFVVNPTADTVTSAQLGETICCESQADAKLLAFVIVALESIPNLALSQRDLCENINMRLATPEVKATWVKRMERFTSFKEILTSLSTDDADIFARVLFKNDGPNASAGLNAFVVSITDQSLVRVSEGVVADIKMPR